MNVEATKGVCLDRVAKKGCGSHKNEQQNRSSSVSQWAEDLKGGLLNFIFLAVQPELILLSLYIKHLKHTAAFMS